METLWMNEKVMLFDGEVEIRSGKSSDGTTWVCIQDLGRVIDGKEPKKVLRDYGLENKAKEQAKEQGVPKMEPYSNQHGSAVAEALIPLWPFESTRWSSSSRTRCTRSRSMRPKFRRISRKGITLTRSTGASSGLLHESHALARHHSHTPH